MSYHADIQQIILTTTGGVPNLAATATTVAKRFVYRVGPNDVTIRSWGIESLCTKVGAVAVSLRVTATAGASSASTGQVSKITLATTNVRGKPKVRRGLNTTVTGGSEIVGQVTTAVTGYIIGAFVYVQPRPADYGNKTRVTLVTT